MTSAFTNGWHHYNFKLVAIKNHEEPSNNPLGHQHLSNWCPLPRSPYFLKSSTVTVHSTWGNSSSKFQLWTEISPKKSDSEFWLEYTGEALLSEAGFEKVFRTQNWVRRSKLFCRWFCFLLGQPGCISVAAWTHLKLASYYFVASGGLIVCR